MNHGQIWKHQQEIQRFIQQQKCTHFFTGTFAKLQSPYSAYQNTEKFFRHYPFDGFGFLTVESLHGVRPHVHGCLRFNSPSPSDSAGSIYLAWERRNGFAKMEESRDAEHVSAYVSKYITKEKTDYYLIL